MEKLDVYTTQTALATVGPWRKDCYAYAMLDLKKAIEEGNDPPLCGELLCLVSRLGDKGQRVEARALVRQLQAKSLLKANSKYESFVLHSNSMDKADRSAMYIKIGRRLFTKYIAPEKRAPFGTIKAMLIKGSKHAPKRRPKKAATGADTDNEGSKTDASSNNTEASGDDSDDEERNRAREKRHAKEEKRQASREEEERDSLYSEMNAEKRNILICLLMRLATHTPSRSTMVGKLIAEMAEKGIMDPDTAQYVLHLNSDDMVKKVMGHLIKSGNDLPTPTLMMAMQYGFEAVRGERLETLMTLAKRADITDDGCELVGKLLASTGIMANDKRRPFSQIELRALVADVDAASHKDKILAGYTEEMRELAKLRMTSGDTPNPSDNEGD